MISLNTSIITSAKVGATFVVAGLAYVQPFRPMMFVGRSMEPTYGNHSLALTRAVRAQDLRRGQVVVIDMPGGPIVKRIVYMPGDKIMQVRFTGHWVDMIDVGPAPKSRLSNFHWREFVVPPRSVYVLGDNQSVSYDSKEFGCVSMSQIDRMLVDQRPFQPSLPSYRRAQKPG